MESRLNQRQCSVRKDSACPALRLKHVPCSISLELVFASSFVSFFHFVRRFWNQVLTWVSVRFISEASWARLSSDTYRCLANSFSMVWIWCGENNGRCFFFRMGRLFFFWKVRPKGRIKKVTTEKNNIILSKPQPVKNGSPYVISTSSTEVKHGTFVEMVRLFDVLLLRNWKIKTESPNERIEK